MGGGVGLCSGFRVQAWAVEVRVEGISRDTEAATRFTARNARDGGVEGLWFGPLVGFRSQGALAL